MLAEAHPVTIDGLPAHLAAFAAVEQLPDADGGIRSRIDRRGQVRYDKVWLHSPAPPPDEVGGSGLAERDLLWLASAASPRRGSRAEALAEAAAASRLFRLLYHLDMSQARNRLGALSGIAPRTDAQPLLDRWLTSLIAQDGKLMQQLAEAVPAAAKTWAVEEAPRLINAGAGTAAARAALTANLCALARRLPADGVPLSVLAEQTVHNTHGLDPATTLGRLAARLAAVIAGLGQPACAAGMREAWEAVGVWADRVSSQVAGWKLPLHQEHPAAAVAAAYQATGEPAVLTLGILSSAGTPLIALPPSGGTIWVVEGVSALTAAAAEDVPASVVCRGGTPSVAVSRLIRAAADAGWSVAISSDFEPRGLHGAITLLRQIQPAGRPWRLTAADYLAGAAEGEPFSPSQVPDTPWDPALAEAMRHRCERVSEEARLTRLLDDLDAQTP
jgi:uncharacterized protein (TIGR02679 family)